MCSCVPLNDLLFLHFGFHLPLLLIRSCFLAIKHGCKHVMQLAKIILRTMRFRKLCDKIAAKKQSASKQKLARQRHL